MKQKPLGIFGLITIVASSLFLALSTFRSSTAEFVMPTLYIDPQTTIGRVSETFSISVSVAEVTDLYGWEFKLYYRNDILNATEVMEGPFLKTGGPTYFTGAPSETGGIWNNYNATHGRIHAWCTLLGEIPGVDGAGVLATITFKAMKSGESNLTLSRTFLINSKVSEIPHETMDGFFRTEGIHDIAVTNVKPFKTVVASFSTKINVTIENKGDYVEVFDVTVYYNSIAIETRTVKDLLPGTNSALTFIWNTTEVAKGNYTISANITVLPHEIDVLNNIYIDGIVLVAMLGDLNGDGQVNIIDVAISAKAFGSYPGHERWNPNADMNDDDKINIVDVAIVAKQFGQKDP